MPVRPFDGIFIEELETILRSTVGSENFDPSGKSMGVTAEPFTGKWVLRSIRFSPGSGRTQVTCQFAGRDNGQEVVATIDASDFQGLIGKRSRDPAYNSSKYSDLAVLVSVYLERSRSSAMIPPI